jgi:NTE family protein
MKTPNKTERKKVCVALQGGGAHGAFAWGVLDKLLEDGRFDIQAVSGTSAGGMNAACVTQGLIEGKEYAARDLLNRYWHGVAKIGESSPYKTTFIDDMMGNFNLNNSPMFGLMKEIEKHFSPYQLNPANKNPFSDYLAEFFNFELFRKNPEQRIFLGTTHVRTGKIKIFTNKDMSADVLQASACLPFMFQAVDIKGEYYWDGGFIANPAIYPLIDTPDTKDIIIIQLTRTHCDELPKTPATIVDRLKEITYNGCLVHEMRAIYFVTKLIDQGLIKDNALKRVNMHLIKSEKTFKHLNLTSALNSNMKFLEKLKEEGRQAATEWIENNYDKVGSDQHVTDEEIFNEFVD